MSSVTLPRHIVNQILAHAQTEPDHETCGLIGGINNTATHCYPIHNIALDTSYLFRMDPKEQIDAMRKMRDAGEELFAIYHSHPHSEAEPSVTDLKEASYPDAIYLIVSLNTEGVLELRGFRLNDHDVSELALSIES